MPSLNPVNWWHHIEGGKIDQPRPPAPGADAPYPNLASVPAKPEPPDKEAMKKLTEALVADRANAHYTAEAAPLPDPSSPSASPGLFGVGAVPPPAPAVAGQPQASVSVPAASAPPAPGASPPAAPAAATAPPPAAAPRKAVQSAPLEPPATPPPPAPEATAQPPLPTAAPPPAVVAGVPSTPPAPPPPGPMPAPAAAASALLEFTRGTAALSPETTAAIKQFAGARGKATVLVTGYGDAEGSDPTTQTVALSLGLSRAQAVANALQADGVPPGSVRVAAEAGGRGVALRLLQ